MSVQSAQSNSDGETRYNSKTFASNAYFPDIPRILPHEKVYPIQIGCELFRLSGASISSDAPSYFSQFFEKQLQNFEEGQQIRTLYIDRDPDTFKDIARHLQGYHISPRDGQHFVRLFADAQFYSLPKLISQLFESEIFIKIGSRAFHINRELFQSPGNSPNYFTLGFAVFFSHPSEVFPGLNREGLLRPPSIVPPEVPNRSGEVFAELLHLLRGYPVTIRSEEHRQELLRDCKYFHLKGLEQKLIPHELSWNARRQKHEICIRLEDIKPSGISFVSDQSPPPGPPVPSGAPAPANSNANATPSSPPGWIHYARPFVDDFARELILEIGGDATRLDVNHARAEFVGTTNARVVALLQVITNKLGLPIAQEWPMGLNLMRARNGGGGPTSGPASPGNTPISEDRVKVRIGPDCHITLDGEELTDRDGFPALDVGADGWATPVPTSGVPGGGGGQGPANTTGEVGSASPVIGWPPGLQLSRPPSTTSQPPPPSSFSHSRKRKRRGSYDDATEWIVKRGQWRLRIQSGVGHDGMPQGIEAVLVAVKLEAFSGEYARNAHRRFLG